MNSAIFDIYNAMFNYRLTLDVIRLAALEHWPNGVWESTTSSIPQYQYGAVFMVDTAEVLRLDWASDRPVTRVTSLNLEGAAVAAWMRKYFHRAYHVMFFRAVVMIPASMEVVQSAINAHYGQAPLQRRVKNDIYYYQKQCGKPPYKLQVHSISPTLTSLVVELYITDPQIRKELSDMDASNSLLQMADVRAILAKLGQVKPGDIDATYLVPSIIPIVTPQVNPVCHMVTTYQTHLWRLNQAFGGDWAEVGRTLGELCIAHNKGEDIVSLDKTLTNIINPE